MNPTLDTHLKWPSQRPHPNTVENLWHKQAGAVWQDVLS